MTDVYTLMALFCGALFIVSVFVVVFMLRRLVDLVSGLDETVRDLTGVVDEIGDGVGNVSRCVSVNSNGFGARVSLSTKDWNSN